MPVSVVFYHGNNQHSPGGWQSGSNLCSRERDKRYPVWHQYSVQVDYIRRRPDGRISAAFSTSRAVYDRTFDLNVNTKLHRSMHHIKYQLQDFGGTIWSTNDFNYFMHNLTKRAFPNNDKQPDKLQPQILSNRVASVIQGYSQSLTVDFYAIPPCRDDCECRRPSVAVA